MLAEFEPAPTRRDSMNSPSTTGSPHSPHTPLLNGSLDRSGNGASTGEVSAAIDTLHSRSEYTDCNRQSDVCSILTSLIQACLLSFRCARSGGQRWRAAPEQPVQQRQPAQPAQRRGWQPAEVTACCQGCCFNLGPMSSDVAQHWRWQRCTCSLWSGPPLHQTPDNNVQDTVTVVVQVAQPGLSDASRKNRTINTRQHVKYEAPCTSMLAETAAVVKLS